MSYASSLCGNCTEVCAVKINLHELLLDNRREAVEEGFIPFGEKLAWKIWKRASLNRSLMNLGNGNIKSRLIKKFFKSWAAHRSELHFSKKTFNEMWKEKYKK